MLIVETDSTRGETYNSKLRSMGLAVRSSYFQDGDDITDLIEKHNPEVILLRHGHSEVGLKDLNSYTATLDNEVPIVLLRKSDETLPIEEMMAHGADDVVVGDNYEHLKQVVRREHHIASMNKRLNSLERLYKESEERNASLLDSSRDAIAYVHEGMHVYANRSYLEQFGYESFDDLEGLPIMDMVVDEKQNDLKNFLRTLDTEDHAVHYNTDIVLADGSVMDSDFEFSSASIDDEPCTQIIIRKQESNANAKELEAQLSKMARIDPNTGLLNRNVFVEELENVLASIGDSGQEYAYFHISIDNFDKYTEELGVVGSDKIIQGVASGIKETLGDSAVACRYDGQIFSHLISLKDRASDIKQRAEALLKAVKNLTLEAGDKEWNELSLSIGVSLIDDPSLRSTEVINRGSKAVKTAAEAGGNRYEVYRPKEGEMTEKQMEKAWREKIDHAIKENRFYLAYQPMVKLDGGELERYEVLLRMRDEHGTDVSPGEFLSAAESTGQAKDIDRWVITNAFKDLVEQFKKGHKTILLIKLSDTSLKDKELFPWIKDRVRASGLPKNCLIFEVKEESVQENLTQARAFAAGMEAIGCGFAIDDFGLSSNPQKVLNDIPAQFIKFHAELTKDLFNNQDNQNKLTELSNAAHEKGRQTIIQHVEDPTTLSVIWTIGSDFIQGHFISPPLDGMTFDFASSM
ncbi:response regulator receiver modulated diguanylate cyclase/phosphodiesterase with PAS/PAC sensor, putative [gamma proteobacterium HTCC5015]|nr:response regulator receiver modulated diguanylate cyclase/phosphodiesterase with PAS/PAC sensor, putative [gamma proteobacterium HTCC5015]